MRGAEAERPLRRLRFAFADPAVPVGATPSVAYSAALGLTALFP